MMKLPLSNWGWPTSLEIRLFAASSSSISRRYTNLWSCLQIEWSFRYGHMIELKRIGLITEAKIVQRSKWRLSRSLRSCHYPIIRKFRCSKITTMLRLSMCYRGDKLNASLLCRWDDNVLGDLCVLWLIHRNCDYTNWANKSEFSLLNIVNKTRELLTICQNISSIYYHYIRIHGAKATVCLSEPDRRHINQNVISSLLFNLLK